MARARVRTAVPAGNGTVHAGRERVSEIQRARLISAFTEVAAQVGVANVTVARIVARAGVSRRTYYELFLDREECFLAALDDAIAGVREAVLAVHDPTARWHERIRGGLVALLAFIEDHPDTGRLLVVGSLGAGQAALERRERILARVIAAVDEGRGEAGGASSLPPMTAEGAVGGALSVLHTRLSGEEDGSLLALTGPLMAMLVLPFLGASAARREIERPAPVHTVRLAPAPVDPLRDVAMRLTYRTVRVLLALAAHPGASNREIARAADIEDQGQASKLLTRLARLGLIENSPAGQPRGAPNAWVLTAKGVEVEAALASRAGG
jgi:AcrR family transcriptional regulator